MLNQFKQLHVLAFFGPNTQQSCPARKNIDHSEILTLLKKIGVVKSKEGRAQMGAANAPIPMRISDIANHQIRSAICIIIDRCP